LIAKRNSMKNVPGRKTQVFQHVFALFFFVFLCLLNNPAFPVDFMSEEDFRADSSSYKDYPLKLLFKKLAESEDSEKREIRSFIILKQVFDENILKKVKDGVLEHKESFGIIKKIDENKLSLLIPETNKHIDYYVGIDKIPVEKGSKYRVTEDNIGDWASVVYSMDDRIYKIKFEFLLAPPNDLYVNREDDKNIVGWSQALSEKKPYAYKLFLNGDPFETVEGTSASVPREEGKVDRYFVKSVYKRGDVLMESKPSDTVYDEITAKELQQKALAGEVYGRVIAGLTPGEHENARKLLYDNIPLLEGYLPNDSKQKIRILDEFFKEIDEGDRLSIEQPESAENMAMAIVSYQNAEQTATHLLPDVDLRFITEPKINARLQEKAILEAKDKKLKAQETYEKILSGLNPSEWEEARRLLNEDLEFLSEHLSKDQNEIIDSLLAFFQDIDEGDRLSSERPETKDNLDSALALYSGATEKADALNALSDSISVGFISDQSIKQGLERKAFIEMREKKLLARERYDQVISSLSPQEWENGKKLLFDNRYFMAEYLDDYLKENMERLVSFFQDIEEGDLLSKEKPPTEAGLENALSLYMKAEQTAKDLPDDIDVLFIAQEKMDDCQNRKAVIVEARERELAAAREAAAAKEAAEREAAAAKEAAEREAAAAKEAAEREAAEREAAAAREAAIALKETPDEAEAQISIAKGEPEAEYDRDAIIQLALEEFDEKDYTSSWSDFLKIFRDQINNIKQGGKNQVRGALGLPVSCRAEIFFLIELDNLKNNTDEGLTEAGVRAIRSKIDNREGVWVIVRDSSKRRKIRRHTSGFDIDSF
jgi:hypothetical protein